VKDSTSSSSTWIRTGRGRASGPDVDLAKSHRPGRLGCGLPGERAGAAFLLSGTVSGGRADRGTDNRSANRTFVTRGRPRVRATLVPGYSGGVTVFFLGPVGDHAGQIVSHRAEPGQCPAISSSAEPRASRGARWSPLVSGLSHVPVPTNQLRRSSIFRRRPFLIAAASSRGASLIRNATEADSARRRLPDCQARKHNRAAAWSWSRISRPRSARQSGQVNVQHGDIRRTASAAGMISSPQPARRPFDVILKGQQRPAHPE